jgi:uncharacterized protein
MSAHQPPLLDLFLRLREAGLPLGVDDYQALVRALQAGFGLPDHGALARLCRTLWVKSIEEQAVFDYHFARALEERSEGPSPVPPVPVDETPPSVLPPLAPPSPAPPRPPDGGGGKGILVLPPLPGIARDEEVRFGRYLHAVKYFPVTQRQMKQAWRSLRRSVRDGPPVELDVEATVDRVAEDGFLLEPVLRPERANRTELLLALDYGRSMVAFHALGQQLAQTALWGGRLGKVAVYYFHNCPEEYLYRDPALVEAELLQDLLAELRRTRMAVLVFSDAGAARGGFSRGRVDLTREFLARLRQQVRHIAWLNPMPQARWRGTTAGAISRLVPMFAADRPGLHQAVRVLRGRPVCGGT